MKKLNLVSIKILKFVNHNTERQDELPTSEVMNPPPDYEAPPDYEEIIKIKSENIKRITDDHSCISPNQEIVNSIELAIRRPGQHL